MDRRDVERRLARRRRAAIGYRTLKVEPLTVGPIVGATTASSVRLWGRGGVEEEPGGVLRPTFGVARVKPAGGRLRSPIFFKPACGIQLDGMLCASEYTFEIAEAGPVYATDNFCRVDVHPDRVEVACYRRKGERLGPVKVHVL